MVCNTCGLAKTDAERMVTHQGIYGVATIPERQGRNQVMVPSDIGYEDNPFIGGIYVLGGLGLAYIMSKVIFQYLLGDD